MQEVTHVKVPSVIQIVLEAIDKGDFVSCISLLEREIRNHNEDVLIDFLLKSVLFWCDRTEVTSKKDAPLYRARYLLGEWKKYIEFCANHKGVPDFDRYLFVFHKSISKIALALLTQALHDPLVNNVHAHLLIARCHRAAGDYETAITEYRRVIREDAQCAAAYAELGDCYLLIGNEHVGRLFLREAFYVDPDGIDASFLESELLANLLRRISEAEEMKGRDWWQWVPVYAVLWDIFTVKRDLRTAEYGMLRQRIYALEREYNETGAKELEPRLLYAYFYLLDYYYKVHRAPISIEETLIKIKAMSPTIYNLYINRKGSVDNANS